MPDLLLELLSEEIPARMQARAADDLRRLVTDALVARGFLYEGAVAFATPRRLALHIAGLPPKGRDLREERKGPRVGAPDAALAGFLKSTGLTREQLTVQSDPKKGDSYVAVIERPGRPTPEVLAEIVPDVIRSFPWPKSMRWGAASAQPGSLRWVRPLQSILCVFDTEIETPEIVPFAVDGIVAGDTTRGHRFMAPGEIRVRRFEDYVAALESAYVVLDPARRRDIILHDARDLAFAQGYEVVEDEGLLEEVAGLVEWPVVLMGSFDASFLAIPPEAIRATIRANQKCFVLRGPGGALANRFVLTANIAAHDGGEAIVAGNERVVRARLSDARFFWESDLEVPLQDRLETLKSIVFHEKLGTQHERVERIAALARELAPIVGADPDLAERAARLAKADLVTEMVGEFPELQGLMGRYYAAAQGEDPSVAAAIEEHYKPVGPSDRVPTDPVSVAVALADKLDTLVGFWAIGETPTGSKDPYALRRAALGVIRLVLENGLRIRIQPQIWTSQIGLKSDEVRRVTKSDFLGIELLYPVLFSGEIQYKPFNFPFMQDDAYNWVMESAIKNGFFETGFRLVLIKSLSGIRVQPWGVPNAAEEAFSKELSEEFDITSLDRNLSSSLLSFFHDRLKVYLRDRGARHDLIDAVLGAGTLSLGWSGQGEGVARSPDMAEPPHPDPLPIGERERVEASPAVAGGNDDLLMVVRRVEALGRLLETEDGQNLVAATKRAANILRIEEAKDGRSYDGAPDAAAFALPQERALADALARATRTASDAIAREDFEGAMRALAELRPAVDAFFEAVTVNDPDPALRANRLALLAGLRAATRAVADLARIEG